MRVQISTHEQQHQKTREPGFFALFSTPPTFTIWLVKADIEFTEEESAVVAARNLWDTPIYTEQLGEEFYSTLNSREARDYASEGIKSVTYRLGGFFKDRPYTRACYSPAGAEAYIQQLETVILPRVKALISTNADVPKTRSFEL
jgi:hypothetical protein